MDEIVSFSQSLDPRAQGIVLATLLLSAIAALTLYANRTRGRHRRGTWKPYVISGRRPGDMSDPTNQLDAVNLVDFEVTKLLNSKEARLLPVLEGTVREIGKGHRVMAQTSMGEILRPNSRSGTWQQRKDAFASINSKRLDFAVFDKYGRLVCAIEYQGDGHHQGKAFIRDAVKREVVRKAGVAWIEVKAGDKPSQLRADVRRALGETPFPVGQGDNARPARTE